MSALTELPLGELEIVGEPIGNGASGVVYKARMGLPPTAQGETRDDLRPLVAVKVFTQRVSTPADLERRKREMMIHHVKAQYSPHIVKVLGWAQHTSQNALTRRPETELMCVMELALLSAEGSQALTLEDALTNVPLRELLRYCREVALALDVLHVGPQLVGEDGVACVVHRDVKPSNVFFRCVSRTERVAVLGDFGLVRDNATVNATTMRRAAGTVGYIAPELLSGGLASAACDVFSLGKILEQVASRFPTELTPGFRNLIANACSNDPLLRPTAHEVARLIACEVEDPPPPCPREALRQRCIDLMGDLYVALSKYATDCATRTGDTNGYDADGVGLSSGTVLHSGSGGALFTLSSADLRKSFTLTVTDYDFAVAHHHSGVRATTAQAQPHIETDCVQDYPHNKNAPCYLDASNLSGNDLREGGARAVEPALLDDNGLKEGSARTIERWQKLHAVEVSKFQMQQGHQLNDSEQAVPEREQAAHAAAAVNPTPVPQQQAPQQQVQQHKSRLGFLQPPAARYRFSGLRAGNVNPCARQNGAYQHQPNDPMYPGSTPYAHSPFSPSQR